MRSTPKILISLQRPGSILLALLLLALTVGASYWISQSGFSSAFLLILCVIGLGVGVFMIVYPEFGFYISIAASFFIFTVLRLFNTDLPLVSLVDVLVWITFAGVLIRKGIRRESIWKHCDSPIVFMYMVFLIYNILEYFNPNGGSKELYFLFFRRTITLILFLYCSIQLFDDMKSMKRFFKISLLLLLVSGLYACYEEWFGLPRFELNFILADPLREKLASLDGGGNYRKSSFLGSCTDFGLLMAGASAILIGLYLKLKMPGRRRRWVLFALIISVLAMTYSGTRTATLMLIVEIGLYVLMTFTERKTLVFFSVFAFILLAVIFGPSYGNGTLRRLKSTFDFKSEESLQVRDINRHGIQPYIYSHPIGGGVGTTGVAYIDYNKGHPLAGFPTDSGLLSIVLEYGWIGLIINCLTYFIILQQGVLTFFKTTDPYRKIMLLTAVLFIFGFVFAQYAQVAIGQIPNSFIFFALNAIIIRLRQMELHKPITEHQRKNVRA